MPTTWGTQFKVQYAILGPKAKFFAAPGLEQRHKCNKKTNDGPNKSD